MNRRSHSGFTLIELMAVLAVIAIMTAVIIPEMRGTMSDARLRSSARTLINACQVASSRAIALNQPHQLQLETQTGEYRLKATGPANTAPQNTPDRPVSSPVEGRIDPQVTVALDPAGGRETETPTSPSNDSPGARPRDGIAFYPDGTAEGPTIVLRDREGFRLALQIQPVTARV